MGEFILLAICIAFIYFSERERKKVRESVKFERKKAILFKSLLQKKEIWLQIQIMEQIKEGGKKLLRVKNIRINGIVTDISPGNYNLGVFLLDTQDNPSHYYINSIFSAAFFNFDREKRKEGDYNDGQLGFIEWYDEYGRGDEKYYKTLFGNTNGRGKKKSKESNKK